MFERLKDAAKQAGGSTEEYRRARESDRELDRLPEREWNDPEIESWLERYRSVPPEVQREMVELKLALHKLITRRHEGIRLITQKNRSMFTHGAEDPRTVELTLRAESFKRELQSQEMAWAERNHRFFVSHGSEEERWKSQIRLDAGRELMEDNQIS